MNKTNSLSKHTSVKTILAKQETKAYQIAQEVNGKKQKLGKETLSISDCFGNTPLHYLALYGWLDGPISKLIPLTAWLITNKSQFTPAQYVRRKQFRHMPNSPKIEKVLGVRGAEYRAIQDERNLGAPQPTIAHLELF